MERAAFVSVPLTGPADARAWAAAEWVELGAEGFVEQADCTIAFVPARTWDGAGFTEVASRCGVQVGAVSAVPVENWNALWEATVTSIEAGPFCVHPPWEAPPDGRLTIRIEPKMSFGTGHHETTRLMLRLMPAHVRPGCRVLDAGTGTGVLAIAACRLGAGSVIGFDIDPWSVDNALENVGANGVAGKVRILAGDLDVAGDGPFNTVLANINRNALEGMLAGFRKRLAPDGALLLSGLLVEDAARMRSRLSEHGLAPEEEATEGAWWAVVARAA